jgi:biopolymer transport protein ExbB
MTAGTVRARALTAALVSGSLLIGLAAQAQAQRPAQQGQSQAPQGQTQQQAQQQTQEANVATVRLGDLRQMVQKLRDEERRTSQERLQKFRAEQQRQERRTQEAVQRKNAAEARSNALDKAWNDNEKRIAEVQNLLDQRLGYLGELFGVTRQVAGDAANVLQQSVLSTQYGVPAEGEERAEFLRRLAGAKALPSIAELQRLWYELVREMTDAGKVVKYHTEVLQADDTKKDMEVVRVGPFTVTSNGEYLGYLPSIKSLAVLNGELKGDFPEIAEDLQAAPPGSGYHPAVVDPSRGALLGLYVERPGVIRRIQQGEAVAYVIVAVGFIGVALALFQAVYLVITRLAVGAQLKNLDKPRNNNPLGRVLLSFRGDGKRIENSELAELRISEAVLREVPKLERFQSFLRLAVAAGPLLGLIGTVIGMIITFRAIVASGSSDPRLMATGIGQAMINTVLGLSIAIPLLFINAGLSALSRGVTQTLDEQSQSMLAENVVDRQSKA